MAYTILRHNLYAEVIKMLIGDKHQLMKTKSIYLPTANGSASFVLENDLAAAVTILVHTSAYTNKVLAFNGPEQITFSAIAEKLSKVTNETIRYVSPELTEFKTTVAKFGLFPYVIDILSTFGVAIANGEFS